MNVFEDGSRQEARQAAQDALEAAWAGEPAAFEQATEALTLALAEGEPEAAGVAAFAGAYVMAMAGNPAEALEYLRVCRERLGVFFGPVAPLLDLIDAEETAPLNGLGHDAGNACSQDSFPWERPSDVSSMTPPPGSPQPRGTVPD